jgi:hypothetical protein
MSAPLPVAPLKVRMAAILAGAPVTTVGGVGRPAGRAVLPAEEDPVPTLFTAAAVNV